MTAETDDIAGLLEAVDASLLAIMDAGTGWRIEYRPTEGGWWVMRHHQPQEYCETAPAAQDRMRAMRLESARAAMAPDLAREVLSLRADNARLQAETLETPARALREAGTFWLIEMPAERHGGRAHWWHPRKGWVPNVNDACQFARRRDAEEVRDAACTPAELVTEHAWIGG